MTSAKYLEHSSCLWLDLNTMKWTKPQPEKDTRACTFFQSKNVSSPINEMITVQKSRFSLLMHIAE